jgi:aspartate/glutamate racemase
VSADAPSVLRFARAVLGLPAAFHMTVTTCVHRLDAAGYWWIPSENEGARKVRSCRQAVKYRERVGSGANGGIPLWAELKSLVGQVVDDEGKVLEVFAAHTRANTRFVPEKLLVTLGFEPGTAHLRPLVADAADREEEPDEPLGLDTGDDGWFGLVNPFNVDIVIASLTGAPVDIDQITQIVDDSIALDGGIPNTLMTNLGERSLAVEIHAGDLVEAITALSPRTKVADVAEPDPIWLGRDGTHPRDYWLQLPPPTGPKIGILTGNGPESGRALWTDLSDALRSIYRFVPDVLAPEVMVTSVPAMGLSMDLVDRETEVEEVVLRGMRELLDAGCQLITVACNTTIYFARQIEALCASYRAEFVSIADACLPAVRNAVAAAGGEEQVGLIGIGAVVDMEAGYSGYRAPLEDAGLKVVPCPADDLAFAVKSQQTSKEFVTEFTRLMRQKLPVEVTVVVLALTEVSMVYRRSVAEAPPNRKSQRVYVDPLGELGRYLAYRYALRGYLESPVCQLNDAEYVDNRLRERLGWA